MNKIIYLVAAYSTEGLFSKKEFIVRADTKISAIQAVNEYIEGNFRCTCFAA